MTIIPTIPHVADHEQTFPELVEMGRHLVGTGFLHEHIKNGAQAAAIILAGRELGMPPMRALRSLMLVKGKVTENADSQLARFKTDGGRAIWRALDETQAVIWLRHPNGDEHTESFTMADATRAGLAGSGMYAKFSKAMLRSRAITAGLKSIGWEGGAGAYDPDELTPAFPGVALQAGEDTIPSAVIDDAITDAQHDLLANVLKSHVFAESERVKVWKRATTRDTASKAIEWATAQAKTRKAAERAESVRLAASDAQDADAPDEADVV